MSTTSKSPRKVLLVAYATGMEALAVYSHPCSPKTFTQPQLFACLVLKAFLRVDYRGVADLLEDRGAEIVPVPVDDHGHIDVQDALETLAHRGITSVLVEGGPSVARAFLDADVVDEVVIYQGREPTGADGLTPFAGDGLDRLTASGHFTLSATRSFGPDRMTLWRRIRSCSQALSAA